MTTTSRTPLGLITLLLLALTCTSTFAVLPDQEPPRPKPQQQKAAPAQEQRARLEGTWSIHSVDDTGIAYSGTLLIDQSLGEGVLKGTLDMSWTRKSGEPRRVKQGALINVDGNKVTINCTNPQNIVGTGDYNADNFHLTLVNSRLIKGYNKDAKGNGGTVVLTR